MKLHEIDVDKFNLLMLAEPDSTIYQSSYWADYMIRDEYNPVFIEATDDLGSCVGLSMFLIKKEGFLFNRYVAYAPHGYLINYYDNDSFNQFHSQIVDYMKNKNVKKIIIEPQVSSENRLIDENLKKLGYRKSKDLNSYELLLNDHEASKLNEYGILKISSEDPETVSAFLSDEEKKMYSSLGKYGRLYVARIDSTKSKRNITDSLYYGEQFINSNKNDYKFNKRIADKEEDMNSARRYLEMIQKHENNNGEDPIIGIICTCFYSDKCSIMFKKILDDGVFEAEAKIVDQICDECFREKIRKIDSAIDFYGAKAIELLGEYTYKV